MKLNRLFATTALLTIMAGSAAAPALGQDMQPAEEQPGSAVRSAGGIGEIIVTARRREESGQDIPVSITALSVAQIERQDISTLERVVTNVPELVITNSSNGSGASLSIRGIGSNFSSVGIEQSVAVIVDGVYYGHGRMLDEGFFDRQQIEILKGPQALFYGKNATAGVISINTAEPGSEAEFSARAGYEFTTDELYGELVASGPLTDTLSARLAVYASNMFGGFTTNKGVDAVYGVLDAATFTPAALIAPVSDGQQPGGSGLIGRLTLKWEPTDAFTNVLRISGTRRRGGSPVANAYVGCPTGVFQTNPAVVCGEKFTTYQNDPPAEFVGGTATRQQALYNRYDSFAITNGMTYDLETAVITSTTNYNFNKASFNADYAQQGLGGIWVPIVSEFKAFSNETRVLTNYDGPLNLLVGFYYQTTKRDHVEDVSFFGAFNSAAPRRLQYLAFLKESDTKGETLSGFAQAIWEITPQFELSAGVRYIHETKDSTFRQPYVNPFFTGVFLEGLDLDVDQTFNDWSPDITATWRPTEDVTLFAAYKTGYKSGGFSNSAVGTPGDPTGAAMQFGPESAAGFEAGLKTLLLDRQMRFNVGVYRYRYTGLQIDYFDPLVIQYITRNAGSAVVKGIEAEIEFAPNAVPGFSVQASANYNDAKYTNFIGPCWTGQSQSEGCNIFDTTGNPLPSLQSLSGVSTANAPDFVGRVGMVYETDISADLMAGFTGDLRYSASYNASPFNAPDARQDAYFMLDATARVGSADGQWEFAVIGRNLTNRQVLTGVMDISNTGSGTGTVNGGPRADFFGYSSMPRTVQVQVSFRY